MNQVDIVAARARSYKHASDLIDIAKKELFIDMPTALLDDDEIASVCRFVADKAPDNIVDVDGLLHYGRAGYEIMISLTLLAFPWFYEQRGLSQLN